MPNGLNNLKGKVDKLNVDNLPQFPTDLRKLRDVVENEVWKKICMMLWSKTLKIKYLVLLN